jgi:uncharacterized protein YggU (UPF0235/DUF167 family)
MLRISVTVHPGSSQKKLILRDDGLHLFVLAKPLEGRANREAVKNLAECLCIPKSSVVLFRGEHSTKKVFAIHEEKRKVLGSVEPALADYLATHMREV